MALAMGEVSSYLIEKHDEKVRALEMNIIKQRFGGSVSALKGTESMIRWLASQTALYVCRWRNSTVHWPLGWKRMRSSSNSSTRTRQRR